MSSFKEILKATKYPPYLKLVIDLSLIGLLFFIYPFLNLNELFVFDLRKVLVISSFWLLIAYFSGIYLSFTRYFNFHELKWFSIFILLIMVSLFLSAKDFRFERLLIIGATLIFALVPYRLFIKHFFASEKKKQNAPNAMIFGAGESGLYLKRSFFNSPHFNFIGFIDDDPSLKRRKIDGVEVFDLSDRLKSFITKNKVKNVVFSTDKITSNRRQFLINYFKELNLKLSTLPKLTDSGVPQISAAKLKNVRIEDLLQRDEITTDEQANKTFYHNKKILVTGGAGSIGSEIVRQLIITEPELIVAVDNSETALFHLSNEFKNESRIKCELLNITNKLKLGDLFDEYQFDFVFHAAAYKHVSVLENNPGAGLHNNIIGTYFVQHFSLKYGVDKFVMISTDKAVNPTNVMGASKRFCELLVHFNTQSTQTQFITTRFGNVLGSNGSVVPIFKEQIDQGGPITVTDPEITRYFMTIPEATKLVLEAGRIGLDKRIYVFDMGEPVKILDLAQNMIRLAGYEPNKDIDIVFTGLRSGEKLYEELLLNTEKMIASDNDYIFVAEKESLSQVQKNQIESIVQALLSNESIDVLDVIKKLKALIPEYISNNSRYSVLDYE